jgi:hypothetical protein
MGWDDRHIQREGWRGQTRENSARLAWAWDTFETTGTGSTASDRAINFGLAFTQKPMFSYGYELLNRVDFEDDDDLVEVLYPASTGFVYLWKQNAAGLYVGAYVGMTVFDGPGGGVLIDPDIQIEHHFTFCGIAMKDVGLQEDLEDE